MTFPRLAACVALACLAPVAGGCAGDAPAQAQTVAGPEVRGGEWFAQTGCTACHSISVYRVWNLAATAPDLSEAVEDVPRRFGVSLESFLHAPTGTMAMVLSTRIPLTPEQRDLAIEKLREAYRLHRGLPDPIAPLASH